MVKVKIYVEGGGGGELLDSLFREAWTKFFQAAGLAGRMPRVVRGKGRARTFDLFRTAVRNRRANELPLLLLDSEDAVQEGHSVWQHLQARDSWERPNGTSDNQAFLMVQVMETWFLADLNTLRSYFGLEFRETHLRAWPKLEEVSKATVLDTLHKATADCGKKYAKGKVSFELLGRVNPDRVLAACPHAEAFLTYLRRR
jgi:hypothetical protein